LCWEVVWVRELSVAEQRYRAVLAVIEDGLSVAEAAAKVGVSRQTMHGWLGRYAGSGLAGLAEPVASAAVVPASDECGGGVAAGGAADAASGLGAGAGRMSC
jgi:hypothetical protein